MEERSKQLADVRAHAFDQINSTRLTAVLRDNNLVIDIRLYSIYIEPTKEEAYQILRDLAKDLNKRWFWTRLHEEDSRLTVLIPQP